MRRLIVTADDFGRSSSINQAVLRAHREGILTCASLMVNGDAADEAITIARDNPRLGVGLHLTLVCGRATLPRERIPDLIDGRGCFSNAPVKTGFRYFARHSLRGQLAEEIEAQCTKFRGSGLRMDHLNGHLNLHLHPTICELLARHARDWGVSAVRLTHDPLLLNLRISRGSLAYRLSHGLIFRWLSARARPALRSAQVGFTRRVFGLLQNGRVDEAFVDRLLRVLPEGDSELYSHPSLDEFRHEYEALVSRRTLQRVQTEGIELMRYQDLGPA